MIVDNLQAGKSCEPHTVQCNIQPKCEEESEEVPGEKIPIIKALALAQVMLQSFIVHMYKIWDTTCKSLVWRWASKEHQAFDHNGSPYGLAPWLVYVDHIPVDA